MGLRLRITAPTPGPRPLGKADGRKLGCSIARLYFMSGYRYGSTCCIAIVRYNTECNLERATASSLPSSCPFVSRRRAHDPREINRMECAELWLASTWPSTCRTLDGTFSSRVKNTARPSSWLLVGGRLSANRPLREPRCLRVVGLAVLATPPMEPFYVHPSTCRLSAMERLKGR